MLSSLYTAATGMLGQQLGMDTVANNLANANTNGYKRNQVSFSDLMYQTFPTGAGTDVQVGRGTQLVSTDKIFDQGVIQQSGNQLDFAIEGTGFFAVQLQDGRFAYTRDGKFGADAQGRLVTPNGAFVYPQMTVPDGTASISVRADGRVTANMANGTTQNVGTLQLVTFSNSQALASAGDNLYFETVNSGRATLGDPGTGGRGQIRQGFIERANVNVVEEMVQMILTQRTYEFNSKVIQTSDSMLGTAVNIRG